MSSVKLELDPLLHRLAVLYGLLIEKDKEPEEDPVTQLLGELNTDWFSNPIKNKTRSLATIPTNADQANALVELLTDLWPEEKKRTSPILGADGKPDKNLTWMEVPRPRADKKSGSSGSEKEGGKKKSEDPPAVLYLVTKVGGTTDNTKETEGTKGTESAVGLGFGLSYRYEARDSAARAKKDKKAGKKRPNKKAAGKAIAQLTVRPFAYLPLAGMPMPADRSGYFVLGSKANPLRLGLDVEIHEKSLLAKLPEELAKYDALRLTWGFVFESGAPCFKAHARKKGTTGKDAKYVSIEAPDLRKFADFLLGLDLELPDLPSPGLLLALLAKLIPEISLPKLSFELPEIDLPDFPDISLSKLILALRKLISNIKLPGLPEVTISLEETIAVEFQIQDIEIPAGSSPKEKKPGKQNKQAKKRKGKANKPGQKPGASEGEVQLQLGEAFGEDDADNWLHSTISNDDIDLKPGVRVGLGRITTPPGTNVPKFELEPSLELKSIGLDLEGTEGKPLFDSKGYQLHGLQSRLYFAWKWKKSGQDTKVGAAVKLKGFGFPLGPQGGGDNPVAANLVGSGGGKSKTKRKAQSKDKRQAKAKAGEDDSVNPTFSAMVGYVDDFHAKVFSDIPSADGKAWVPIDRAFGPLHCRQIGLGFDTDGKDGPRLGIGYDGRVALGPLAIELDRLTIDIPLKNPQELSEYELGLAGLGVSYSGGPISISGGFFKGISPDGSPVYDGMALIQASNFTITGFGSYAVVADEPSLFIFAILHKELGGPPCFRVTALAAGFGYNRALRLPPIEEVADFPLVRGALEEDYFSSGENSIQDAMVKLREYIPPSDGEYWFAAGVRFSSFEMIESFALLSVSFGKGFEIGLLGMSKLTLPRGAEPDAAVAYAELTIKAVINPEEGLVAVEGRLTDESYIFSKACRIEGGFAFYLWAGGRHAGDFVLTLGGYHPAFVRPDHYPVVPRLKIHWQLNPCTTLDAEMYFALTPSCLMTGGKLSVVYEVPCIRAWFTAYADLLLNWQPFYYLADMGISIGVAATVRIPLGFCTITISIRVELSVDLHLWGPPFAGEARVDLAVISFTIPFGEPKKAPAPLKPQEFLDAFLPPPSNAIDLPAAGQSDVIAVQINSGLLYQREKGNALLRVVNGHALSITAGSLIPSTRFSGLAESARYKQPKNERPDRETGFGIRPMAKKRLNSAFDLRLEKEIDDAFVPVQKTPENLRASFVENGVPDALWGPSAVDGEVALPGQPEALTINATVGIRFSFDPIPPEHALFPIPLEKLKVEQLPTKTVEWQEPGEAETIGADGKNTFWNTIWGNEVVDTRRNAILDVLARQSPFALNEPELEQVAGARHSYFQEDPELSSLGEGLK